MAYIAYWRSTGVDLNGTGTWIVTMISIVPQSSYEPERCVCDLLRLRIKSEIRRASAGMATIFQKEQACSSPNTLSSKSCALASIRADAIGRDQLPNGAIQRR